VRIRSSAGLSRSERRRAEFHQFVTESSAALLRTAYLVAWDLTDAEDLVQDCLVVIARRWPRVRSMDHPHAYARRVLINLALDGSAKRSRRRRELDPGDDAGLEQIPDGASERALQTVDVRGELIAALATLPPRQRAVLVLRYFEDLSEAETARVMGCSVGTVKSTASRGLARLQTALTLDVPLTTKEPLP
jgi:RNA polymerase sigma-70 factor (sigma-E family)